MSKVFSNMYMACAVMVLFEFYYDGFTFKQYITATPSRSVIKHTKLWKEPLCNASFRFFPFICGIGPTRALCLIMCSLNVYSVPEVAVYGNLIFPDILVVGDDEPLKWAVMHLY